MNRRSAPIFWTFVAVAAASLLATAGCGEDGGTPAADTSGAPDAADAADAADATAQDVAVADTVPAQDALGADATADVTDDTGPPTDTAFALDTEPSADTTPLTWPRPGFGAISGDCDQLDSELTGAAPAFFVNHIDFAADGYDPADLALLTPGGQTVMTQPNAGGSSVESEAFAFELLARCEGATLLKTETQISYDVQGKITDLLVTIDGLKVGVSVVRAVGFPKDAPYTVEQATTILHKKLSDILVSSANVSAEDAWVKQILHVLAYDAPHVASLEAAWQALPEAERADTVVIVTVSDGDDAFLY